MGKLKRIVLWGSLATVVFAATASFVGGGIWAAQNVPDIYDEHVALAPEGTTVAFHVGGCMSRSRFIGSGAVIGHRDGRTFILTASHVVMAGSPQSLNIGGLAVRVEKCSLDPDLALVSIPDIRGTAFERDVYPRERFPVWIEAYFQGEYGEPAFPVVTMGIVSNQEQGWLDATAMGGFSGGAVMNWRGQLVGILVAGYVDWRGGGGLNIVEPSTAVEAFLDGEGW